MLASPACTGSIPTVASTIHVIVFLFRDFWDTCRVGSPRQLGTYDNNLTVVQQQRYTLFKPIDAGIRTSRRNDAMTNSEQTQTIYPDYCHELSPTIGRWCPLRAVDVHTLHSVGMYDNGMAIPHARYLH